LFSGHNLAAAAVAGMTKRQTKFGRRDVNDAGRTTENKIDSESERAAGRTVVAGVSPAD